ncbi:MAG: NAD+ synthase [Desulfobacterales bacterium]|nr:NAD+ synthase [Desulfobacterales bacterium]
MKIALAQINPTVGDFSGNAALMIHFAAQARDAGCDLVVFPELATCGYPPGDLLERPAFIDANLDCLHYLVETIQGIGVVVGYAERNPDNAGKGLFNALALFENGEVLFQVFKRLLPTYDVFDEHRHFEPGRACEIFTYKGLRIGLTICEDAWNDPDTFAQRIYAEDPVERLASQDADLLVNISASPFHIGKRDFRHRMLAALARKYAFPVVHVNQVGGNDSLVFDGTSAGFDTSGTLVARCRDFEEDLVVMDVAKTPATASKGQIHPVATSDPESVLAALVLGTRDYVHKCGFKQAVIGLSGGIDSALTAAVAARALGAENVTTVFMPSGYTSGDNYEDTAQLARNLGVAYRTIPIDAIFTAFVTHLSPNFDPAAPGVTEQNIQARIRGTLLMGLSNQSGALVLSTGNKSELAVGYCTLYGDMNGGLAVISDVPKTLVYEVCAFLNTDREIIPGRILEKAPSAELKPDQTDQDDLPDYALLDAVLKGMVEEFKGADTLIQEGHDPAAVRDIFRRVEVNEYKRHQAAPGIKVTSKAFGSGRRYPIAKVFRPLR